MAAMPPEIEEVLEDVRATLIAWHNSDALGEIAILRGQNQWQVQERPVRNHGAIRREYGGMKVVVKT